ncbi:5'-AMP-activated serine/threonine-protein kinase catalytic subunit alpha-like isoform X2 [Rosa chinensis]|uniref:5'-AMP-activated serine/threonine-protein kinase catalytic subunit alpha-like isoform X2 n=1 Tax=Rosa chinensis TaxID=74649 RepID=UPI001AD8F4BE|nr:5'-AMP-activated serine/threonine-protein kinase catalytic subunit alpha-like isoform X2 [Rosa chinensis]
MVQITVAQRWISTVAQRCNTLPPLIRLPITTELSIWQTLYSSADLIHRMTAWEAKDRINIREIKNHRWFQGGDQMFLNDPHGISDQGIDNNILLEAIKKTQCEREYLIQSLIQGEHTGFCWFAAMRGFELLTGNFLK